MVAFWSAFMVTIGGLGLVKGRSALVGNLSETDRSRFRFPLLSMGKRQGGNGPSRVLGWIFLRGAASLLALATARLTLP